MKDSATTHAGPDGLRVDKDEAVRATLRAIQPPVAEMLMNDYGWTPARYETCWRTILQNGIHHHGLNAR